MNDDELRRAFDGLLDDLPDETALPAATARRVTRRRNLKVGAGALGGTGVLAVAAALILGTTGPGQDRLVPPANQPTATPSASPIPTVQSPPPTSPSSPPPTQEPAPAAGVVLRPDGLAITDSASSTSVLVFGTESAVVQAALDDALGQGGPRDTPDCGESAVTVQYESLFLQLQDGEFVGWTTGSPDLTTADGIGIGTTVAELRAALPEVTISAGTLGAEWTTVEGGLAGFLDGTADSNVVNSMAAGVRCLAR